MKKLIKTTLVPGLVSLFAGVALAAILFMGFRDEIIAQKNHFSITEDDYWSFFQQNEVFNAFRSGDYHGSSEYKDSFDYEFSRETSIHGICFEIAVGDVNIITGSEYSVQVTGMYENAITSRVEDGIWYIEDELMKSGSVGTDYCPYIDIVVPENVWFEDLEIHLAAGKLYAEEFMVQNVVLTVDAGSLSVDRMTATDSIILENGVGETRIYSIDAANLTVDNGVGAVSVCGVISGSNKVTCGIGEVVLTLKGRTGVDFDYSVDCGLGEVVVEGTRYQGSTHHSSGHRRNADMFELDCGIGRIELNLEN